SYLRLAENLPSAEAVIVKGEYDVKIPAEPSARYAFSGALVHYVMQEKKGKEGLTRAKRLFEFCAEKMPNEFALVCAKDYLRTDVGRSNID
ncbi:unnamed protein product, partial [marine sediment metagenome]